jgi:AAA+ superfamily predicted ATPase
MQDLTLLQHAEIIYHQSKDCKLEGDYLTPMASHLKVFEDWLNLTPKEAFITVNIFGLSLMGYNNWVEAICNHLECDVFKIHYFQDTISSLKLKLILRESSNRRFGNLEVTEKISKAIIKNELNFQIHINMEDELAVFDTFNQFYENLRCNEIEQKTHKEITEMYMQEAQKFPLFKWIKNLQLSWRENVLLFRVTWEYIIGYDETNLKRTINDYLEQERNRIEFFKSIIDQKNILVKNKLLKIESGSFSDNVFLTLADEYIQILSENNIDISVYRTQDKKSKDYISSDSIHKKTLFLNPSEAKQVKMLASIIQNDKLLQIQENLKEKGMPSGINILLYGLPGTGKTETAFQLAQMTGRAIWKYDLSEAKSMWFGQSEKQVKRIFTDYKALCKKEEITPILLFNEADALISKRGDVDTSSVKQVENSIQNILLDELENFEGIFIATTNMLDNIDAAFERRFLYKLQFENPNTENLKYIWMDKLTMLNENEATLLANEFPFSGGQIENIARKVMLYEIIENKEPNIDTIIEFCEQETWHTADKSRRKMGF